MTRSDPLHCGLDHMDVMAKAHAVMERERKVGRREFDDWPILDDEMLGPILLKSWKGEYDAASEALQEARRVLEASGVKLSTEQCDEIDGINCRQNFVVESVEEDGKPVLRLRSLQESEHADKASEQLEESDPRAGSGRTTARLLKGIS